MCDSQIPCNEKVLVREPKGKLSDVYHQKSRRQEIERQRKKDTKRRHVLIRKNRSEKVGTDLHGDDH